MISTRKTFYLCFLFILEIRKCTLLSLTGGTNARIRAAPFIVSLQYNDEHYCAGSIINRNWVITAAHCLSSSKQVLGSTIVAGSIYVSGKGSTTQKRCINFFERNELYVGGTAPYDIGFVYTKVPFKWTNAVGAVRLPTKNVYPRGRAIIYGWGTSNTQIIPKTLQMATVSVISLKSCETALGFKRIDLHNTNLCTGSSDSGAGICSADSGGPLVQNNVLIGIASWGKLPCGQKNAPSVFTRVSVFLKWIKENIAHVH